MKFLLTWIGKSALELLLPAAVAAAGIVIVFLLFRGKARPSRKRSQASRRDARPTGNGASSSNSSSEMLPRFLLLGPSNSGKTSLLDGLRHVFSSHDRTWITDLASGVACWHLDGGQVLEVEGKFFEPSGNGDAVEKEWKALLGRLQRERPHRPLDGIVLALPATHLAGEHALSHDDLRREAAQMEKQLNLLRVQLGFSLPLYLVITKCDAIPGYTTFAERQLASHAGEIFGWSNPYNLDAHFDASWTAQAFAEIDRVLCGERAQFFARRGAGPARDFAAADELFLFSSRLAELERPAAAYLEQLLENSGHRDGLMFRGIYFAGSAAHHSRAFDETRSRSNGPNRVGFAADLFRRKIFPERGLARPLATALAGRNIAVSVFRALCLALVLLLFPAALYAWYSLSKSGPEISRHLRQVCKDLRVAANQDATSCGAGNEPGAGPAYSTIYAAQALSGGNFQSIFLPASLIDSLDSQTEPIMARAFNQLVYPGLENALEQKTRDLLRSNGEAGTAPQRAENARSLADFTEAFLKLEENIIFYNKLARGKGSGKDVMALAMYLSPETFAGVRRRNAGLDDIVRDSFTSAYEPWGRAIPFDTLRWNEPAIAKLKEMTTETLEQSAHENELSSALRELAGKIRLLEANELKTYDDLNGLLENMNKVQTELGATDLQWIVQKNDQLQLPDELRWALARIFAHPEKNVLLCDAAWERNSCAGMEELKSALERMALEHFEYMRGLILNEYTKTTGPLIAVMAGKLQFSQPAANLQSVLGNFLKLPFVAHNGTAKLRDWEDGKQLFWDSNRLQAALQDKQAYDQFFGSQLANTSQSVQDTFERIALARLEANMVDSIALSQHFDALPSPDKAEQSTRDEARSFQTAVPLLEQVLQQFSTLNVDGEDDEGPSFDDDYDDLLNVSTAHALALLTRINGAFDARHFYWPAGKFDSWTNNSPPSLSAYSIHNQEEMAAYLVAQRQDIEQYVAEAQPATDFLQRHGVSDAKGKALTAQWQSIVADLKNYQTAPAGSGIGSVEDFLANGMDKVIPPDCQGPATPTGPNLVYFARVRRSLEYAVVCRCRTLLHQSAFGQYKMLAEYFNQNLAGKFPFSTATAVAEVDPAKVIEFFRLLDANEKALRLSLQRSAGRAGPAKIAAFLDQMDALRPLFASLLTGQPGAAPAFDLSPVFRVNRDPRHEINGNQIIDWNLQAGESTFRNFDPPATGRWNYGDPVTLKLRWAKNSPQQPVPIPPATADEQTGTLIFKYDDPWSLLRMLTQHAAPAGDLDRGVDIDPQTLVFTAGQKNANAGKDSGAEQGVKVFIRVRIYAPGKTEPLKIPVFPMQAP